MNSLKKWFQTTFKKNNDDPQKKKVCWLLLGKILGNLLFLTPDEEVELNKLDDHNPKVLQELIREYVVPHFHYFTSDDQEKIKNSLIYYLAIESEKLAWIFSSLYAPFDDDVAKSFYAIVWQELYGTEKPETIINPINYEEDCHTEFFNSVTYSGDLVKKYNPEGKKPSLANVIARIKQNS